MADHPILLTGPTVLALLEGRKTQTRRLAWRPANHSNLQDLARLEYVPEQDGDPEVPTIWQKCAIGDRLWVRERIDRVLDGTGNNYSWFAADQIYTVADAWPWKRGSLPSIHMPRSLSRLTLTVTDVRVQRVQEISEDDVRAEGYPPGDHSPHDQPLIWFSTLWDTLNGRKEGAAWSDNPWIVAVTFTTARENIDGRH